MVSATCELLSNEEVAPGHYVMKIAAPEIAHIAQPGQFVHLKVPGTHDPLLRRPISIMLVDKAHGQLRLLVRIAGRGTRILANLSAGASIDLLGPLGTPFNLPASDEKGDICLVAGGVGVAPLIGFADALRAFDPPPYIRGLFGAQTQDLLVCWTEFAARCDEFYVRTDDGTAGGKGFVSDALADQFERGGIRIVYACGPAAMMAAIAAMARENGVPCYCSFEQKMGCGIGACLSCAIPAAGGGYLRVCKDGPVFSSDQIDWEALLNE